MSRHARLPPSSASRWTVCTASTAFIERNRSVLPPDSSPYADEGTKMHELVAQVLGGRYRLLQTDDPDQLIHGRDYVDFVRTVQRPDDKVGIEKRVSLFYLPDQHGTVDVLLQGPERIAIVDLKYGVGVSVQAENNKQLGIYAESAIQELELVAPLPDDFPVHLYIFQPRDRNDSEPIRVWKLTRSELRSFAAPIAAAAHLVLSARPGDLAFIPDPEVQCKFCPAAGICSAYASYGLSIVPEDMSVPDPTTLTRAQRIRILDASSALQQFLNAVEAQEMSELSAGAEPMGYKLVEGKSNRKWSSDEEAIEVMAMSHPLNEVAPRCPISPAAAMKAFEADERLVAHMNKIIVKPPGKPTLVPESDPRPVLHASLTEGLERIDLV